MNKIGCPELIALDGAPGAAHLNYLDLMSGRRASNLRPKAVAEFQGRPVLYLVDGLTDREQPSDAQVRELGQLLANRSEHAMLGVVRPGELTLYPINLSRAELDGATPKPASLTNPDPLLFQSLATGLVNVEGQPTAPDYVFDEIHELLTAADKALAGRMSPLEVLSVAGRALFFRFLHDRRIVLPAELQEISPKAKDLKDVFSDAECAAATSCWLDETFNGDLLPLVDEVAHADPAKRLTAYRKFFREAHKKTDGKIFLHLQAIMRGWKHLGDSTFQTRIDWDDFDFAHIPIGVLSQVYETFSRRWDEAHAEETSVHYTPKNIAHLLVEEALAGVKNAHDAVVLDPACGAGAFLVLAFRHLVRLHWQHTGQRPDKKTIHRILYRQIRGFDVSESALRLAALALYITAIELNGTTRPPKILKFPRVLQDEVLFNFDSREVNGGTRGFVLGSLSAAVPTEFDASFDVVLGNPPWTRLRSKAKTSAEKAADQARFAEINRAFTTITRRALKARNLPGLSAEEYDNPDNNPDLPFIWRATEWAKPGGMIAFALPARIILKQSEVGQMARKALFSGLTVTGILNASDLEKTPVWRNMDVPFMLLFARNVPAASEHRFQFITPLRENPLIKRAEFRIDYQSAQPVSLADTINRPWTLKALGVGTVLDIEVWDKVKGRCLSSVGEVWSKAGFLSGEGYNISAGLPQAPARHLLDLPDFKPPENGFAIDFKSLDRWEERHRRTTANRPRENELYQSPLVIIPQTPGETREQPKAFLSVERPIAFSKSYYGYSTSKHPDAEVLARLLYLVVHSELWQHYSLTHSSRIGASYRTILKEELDGFPFVDPSNLALSQRQEVFALSTHLASDGVKSWDKIDHLIFALYGLSEHDVVVVRDTIKFGAPYRSSRDPAALPPDRSDCERFCRYLQDMLQPFVGSTGARLHVEVLDAPAGTWMPSWRFVTLGAEGVASNVSSTLVSKVMREANRTAASRVIMVLPQHRGLLVGLLNQRRFWSKSRARLCGLHIVRQHLGAFRPR
ncbi:HsdM family class I SAM-dependent methyltransferase [Bradyrhizobium yuanmingense]|uniref:HsdM family class I SAM-dependent methyltransferase n=1 Tax=Bradyrhizobium yuanmingense TaxID=108015 RepID=UPI0023B890D8|nr:N-6 DNA methylase [Bradyrhizobium yuanmingense]MDF0492750.1 N-6 DNA methylase [Bradyrhizobium yuanmingense]